MSEHSTSNSTKKRSLSEIDTTKEDLPVPKRRKLSDPDTADTKGVISSSVDDKSTTTTTCPPNRFFLAIDTSKADQRAEQKRKVRNTVVVAKDTSNVAKSTNTPTPYLITFDTEVNGWRKFDENGKKLEVDPDSRIAQIGWCVFDKEGNIIKSESYFISPTDWEVNEKQTSLYEITEKLVEEEGVPINEALLQFMGDIKWLQQHKGRVGGHKTMYDTNMIIAECNRIVTEKDTQELNQLKSVMEMGNRESSFIDTFKVSLMKQLNDHQKFKNSDQEILKRKLKWFVGRRYGPRLGDLHAFVCGGDKLKRAHHAQYDSEMCGEVIFSLKDNFGIDLLL